MKWQTFFAEAKYQAEIYILILKIWLRHILLGRDKRWRRYFWDRLGMFSSAFKFALTDKCLWIQAVSEGDIISLENFLERVKKSLPKYRIIFSTRNFGCFDMLKNFDALDAVFYLPWDIKFICRKVLKIIKPRLFIMIEAAYYPALLSQAKSLGVPSMVLSGFYRRSTEEMAKYKRLYASDIFGYIDFLGMQTSLDAEKIVSLGADKDKVKVSGSLKMDLDYAVLEESEKQILRREFNIDQEAVVIVAGAVHPGEERIILEAYQDILLEFKEAVLIIAPRYKSEIDGLEKIIDELGLQSIKRTALKSKKRNGEIIIIDNFGELPKLYGVATVVILGGSLCSGIGGGHNVLEPAFHQKPFFFGPMMHCRGEFLEELKAAWEGLEVKDKNELAKNILYLLNRPAKLKEVGLAVSGILEDKEEIISKNVELIKEMVKTK